MQLLAILGIAFVIVFYKFLYKYFLTRYNIIFLNNVILLNYLTVHGFSHTICNAEHWSMPRYYKIGEIYYLRARNRLSF